MKKYAIVETEKSTRIFISAFTWFLRRTVPSSRKAKPACIASTITAPSRMNRTSADVLRACISRPPLLPAMRPAARILSPPGVLVAQEAAEVAAEALQALELLLDEGARIGDLVGIEHGVETLPFLARFAERRTRQRERLVLGACDGIGVGLVLGE